MDFIADTSLLVGLWRRQDWALAFAHKHPDGALGVPWVVLGEFWHGAIRAGHSRDRVQAFLMLGIPLMDEAAFQQRLEEGTHDRSKKKAEQEDLFST